MEQINKPRETHVSAEEMLLLVDKQLATLEMEECKAHIENCMKCSREYQLLVEIETATQTLPPVEPSPNFIDSILLECEATSANVVQPLPARTQQRTNPVWIGVATFLILGGVVVSLNMEEGESYSFSRWLTDAMASGVSSVQSLWGVLSGEVWSMLLVLILSFVILSVVDNRIARRHLSS